MRDIDLEIIEKIFEKIKEEPLEYKNYMDAFIMISDYVKNKGVKTGCEYSQKLRELLDQPLREGCENIKDFIVLRDNTLLLEAPYIFDSYCQYLEINVPVEKKLYLPRRKVLKNIVELFQKVADKELDEIFISMPPRTGKTTIATFFVTWIIGKDPELSNLYSSYSDSITNSFYNGVLQIINDPDTYTWNVVFPKAKVVGTNAANETININSKKKYASLTCRSVEGTLNGACDCEGYLIMDDLLSGSEEALSLDRLRKKMQIILNNLLTRAKPTTAYIWIGTRWSLYDPMGVRLDMLENDDNFKNRKYALLSLPALNENGNTNFDYSFGKGFSTEKFIEIRAGFEKTQDIASWMAQYMCEPIEREDAVFKPEELKYFNGVLPEGEPDRRFMAVDVALGGGDYLSAPVCYQYGADIYVVDWIFDNRDKSFTRPKVVSAIEKYGVERAQFERNNGGGMYKDLIEQDLRAKGIMAHLTSKSAPTGTRKEDRIFDASDDIKLNFYFLEDGKRGTDYSSAMTNLFSFKRIGKNKNDDAPDSLAQAWAMIDPSKILPKYTIFKKPI